MTNLEKFSEQSLIQGMKCGLLSYRDFCVEINRRVVAGEHVHPYHASCAKSELS